MAESLADRMQLCKDRYNDIPQGLIDEVRALGLLAKMRPMKDVEQEEEINKLKAENAELESRISTLIQYLPKQGLLKAIEIIEALEERRLLLGDADTGTYGDIIRALREADSNNEFTDTVFKERDKLNAQLAEYKYTSQAYDEMWKRVKEAVNENDELKAQLEDCTAVNAEVMKKVARLEKSINIQETDSN